jgi:benzil reductase ((S)-benzoin forming)
MNYYYITGTSRGLGKSLVERLLRTPNNVVIGISRTPGPEHKNYTHFHVDLADPEMVKAFHFPPHHDAKRVVLINNAGVVGQIKTTGRMISDAIIRNYNVNLIAPTLLMNSFMEAYKESNAEKIIVGMSSGAAKNPIGGWGPYCASKAGLDMFSRVAAEEQKSVPGYKFKIMSIAPGIVDTLMQEEIRSSSVEDFSRLNDFINYKIENQLAQPDLIASKYIYIIEHAAKFPEVVFSVKDLNGKE